MTKAPLTGSVHRVADLTSCDETALYDLMTRYYENVRADRFRADLREKSEVVMVRDERGVLRGFSTICGMELRVEGEPLTAVFSGDTVIDKPYWGGNELQRLWLSHVLAQAERRPHRSYWFLICKGYKTYRFLPVFFHEYLPRAGASDAWLQAVLDAAASVRFGDGYDARTGIIRLPHGDRLRPGVADVTADRLADSDVRYFVERNPGWASGDELACITHLHRDNLRPAGYRLLGMRGVRAMAGAAASGSASP